MKVTYTYEKIILNGSSGWLATRRVDGLFMGTAFGSTKKAARAAFDLY